MLRFNPDENIRSLEREYSQTGDINVWRRLQVARQRADQSYDRAYILRTQSHEQILRQKARLDILRHGEHLLITIFSNDWRVDTWWDENEWDEHGLYPGEPISWTTLVYDDLEEGHQIGSPFYCQTFECAITHHKERVQSVIDGSIEDYGGIRPLWDVKPRHNPDPKVSHGICAECYTTTMGEALSTEKSRKRIDSLKKNKITVYCSWCKQLIYDPDTDIVYRYNPECFICQRDPCRCDPKYRQWLDRIDDLLVAAVGMRKRELPSDYMWSDAFVGGLSPIAAINMMVGPLDDPERLREAIYIEAAGFGPFQREHKLSNKEIGDIALEILQEEVKRADHYYHGSPYSGLSSTAEFEGRYLFLTPSPSIAKDYTIELPASGKRPKNRRVRNQKTIYTLVVNLPENVIFDTRKTEHQQLYQEIRNQLKLETDPEDWPSRDLMITPDLPDSPLSTAGFYPDFGSGLNIIPKLQELGFRALWVSEGSQGASLGLFYPEDAEIIDTQHLRDNPLLRKDKRKAYLEDVNLKQADIEDIDDNILIMGPFGPAGEFMGFHPSTYILYFMIDPDSDEKTLRDIISGPNVREENFPVFPIRGAFGGPGSLALFWKLTKKKKRFLDAIAGAVQYILHPDEDIVLLTHMAVKRGWKRRGINSAMIEKLIRKYPDRRVVYHSSLTEQGRKFMESFGGEEWRPPQDT